jgi:hypothetical protein
VKDVIRGSSAIAIGTALDSSQSSDVLRGITSHPISQIVARIDAAGQVDGLYSVGSLGSSDTTRAWGTIVVRHDLRSGMRVFVKELTVRRMDL